MGTQYHGCAFWLLQCRLWLLWCQEVAPRCPSLLCQWVKLLDELNSVCSSCCSSSSLGLSVNGWHFSSLSGLNPHFWNWLSGLIDIFTNHLLCCPSSSSSFLLFPLRYNHREDHTHKRQHNLSWGDISKGGRWPWKRYRCWWPSPCTGTRVTWLGADQCGDGG